VINKIGDSAGVYVIVTLRSDESMSVCNANDDATCFPEAATHAVYRALVDSFANKPHVMFGLSNEPGGNIKTSAELRQAMSAAVDAIRARERELGVPEHIVVVQGNNWTSAIDFYATQPLTQTNVVYEYHSYPPTSSEYTFANIPVIIGEYGGANWQGMSPSVADAFFRDIEAKKISSLAWYFSPYSAVAPALLNVTHDGNQISPNRWGTAVRDYLLNPAQYQ
jgi:aryl-phospho-beta-D-glucosidase BglC (GH1 family)